MEVCLGGLYPLFLAAGWRAIQRKVWKGGRGVVAVITKKDWMGGVTFYPPSPPPPVVTTVTPSAAPTCPTSVCGALFYPSIATS